MTEDKKGFCLKYEVCDFCIEIHLDNLDAFKFFEEKFGNFISDKKADFKAYFNSEMKDMEVQQLMSPFMYKPNGKNGSVFYFKANFASGYVDFEKNKAEFNTFGTIMHITLSIESSLRLITSYYSIRKGFLLLHSSAVKIDKDNAICFCAPSGSGKSTIATLSGYDLLSDDMNAVRNNNAEINVYSTPYGGDYYGTNLVASLKGIFFIFQSDVDKLIPCSFSEGIERMIDAEYEFVKNAYFGEAKEAHMKALREIYFIAKGVPLFKLYFTKSRKFLDLINEVL